MAPTLYYTRDTPALTGFQSEPTGRGTIGIIWTCLSTILLSSWSSFHSSTYDPNKSFKAEAYKSYETKFIAAFLFPEAGAVESLDKLYDALQLRKTIRQVGGPQFASFSLSQAFVFVMEGVWQEGVGSAKMEEIGPEALVQLVRSGTIQFSHIPTDEQIADKSKRDWTLKLLSIIQTAWFIISVITRLSRGYPVSLYEDITVANAVCGIIEFACWFYCPQDIRLPFIIGFDNTRSMNDPSAAPESGKPGREETVESTLLTEAATEHEASSAPPLPVPEDIRTNRVGRETPITKHLFLGQKETRHRASSPPLSVEYKPGSDKFRLSILAIFSVLFSGIHIAAWKYSFCSLTEAWIWRGSSLALIPLGVYLPLVLSRFAEDEPDDNPLWYWMYVSGVMLYPIVRTMMLGISLASFRKAPARLYETLSWTQYWPHI